jgi:xylulose-5-phosphate/fructose-6-phosphate phosphoketolase
VDDGVDPDVYVFRSLMGVSASYHPRPHRSVVVGIGVEVTFEVIAAAVLLRKYAPALRVRVVNVTDLMILAAGGTHPHALSDDDFEALFTRDRAVHINFHGYPIELKGLLFGRPHLERMTLEGYREEGTTTSPFDVSKHFILYHSSND